VSFLLELTNGRRGLKASLSDDSEPEFALVGFFGHHGQLGYEQRSRIRSADLPVVGSNGGAGID
jgi:hypothetical protein